MAKQKISYDPQVVDLELYAGDAVKFDVTVTDPLGAPVDLSGTMIAQIRPERDSLDPPSAEFTVDLADALNGVAVLILSGEQTQALVSGDIPYQGVWDLQWTPSDNETITICQGKVECSPDVSR